MVKVKISVFVVLFAVLTTSCNNYKVLSVKSGETGVASGGLFYALPLTEVCVDVLFQYRDTSNAPYLDYAADMLALDLPKSLYTVKDIRISARNVADPDHYYFVHPGSLSVQVDGDFLLRSIGVDEVVSDKSVEDKDSTTIYRPMTGGDVQAEYNLYDRTDTFYRRNDRPGHPTMLLSKKDSRSRRQRAVAVAERIGGLQDRRQQLLEGNWDDGLTPEMVRYQLEMIDRQEQLLVQQFSGRYVTETVRFVVVPEYQKNTTEDQFFTLFYYSPSRGIADSGDVDAVPVICQVHSENRLRTVSRFVRHHTGDASNLDKRPSFKYRCSESATVTVSSEVFRYQRTLPVAQFGPVLELPKNVKKALFDDTTGSLIFVK